VRIVRVYEKKSVREYVNVSLGCHET